MLYDKKNATVYVIYSTRYYNTGKYEKQIPIVIKDVKSIDEIIEQAENGFRSLSDKITFALYDNI